MSEMPNNSDKEIRCTQIHFNVSMKMRCLQNGMVNNPYIAVRYLIVTESWRHDGFYVWMYCLWNN